MVYVVFKNRCRKVLLVFFCSSRLQHFAYLTSDSSACWAFRCVHCTHAVISVFFLFFLFFHFLFLMKRKLNSMSIWPAGRSHYNFYTELTMCGKEDKRKKDDEEEEEGSVCSVYLFLEFWMCPFGNGVSGQQWKITICLCWQYTLWAQTYTGKCVNKQIHDCHWRHASSFYILFYNFYISLIYK